MFKIEIKFYEKKNKIYKKINIKKKTFGNMCICIIAIIISLNIKFLYNILYNL